MSQPALSLATLIDPQLGGVLIANMLEAWLAAESTPRLFEERPNEPEDHATASQQAGVHLYPSLFRVLDYSECRVLIRNIRRGISG